MTQRWLAALLAVIATCGARAHFSDWGGLLGGGRPSQPTCVDIPRNMSLCHGIGYHQMRLPNLLEHDTMAEVLQQAGSWVPLLNVRCHPDTQLFVCSLFSPVCLDRPIYPCRSLCDQVRQGCEGRMKTYGFPWPDMFRCDKFPLDNDMCIASQSAATTGKYCHTRQPASDRGSTDPTRNTCVVSMRSTLEEAGTQL
uniref:FZ domain-containing protein n=1 Tax=Timema cristinae TaxID=61476 RepID=A0A7R9H501_TIMCR|nr:unnamed protein product [Timema cristinae]